ncbi:MAG: hypothetical protein Q8R18_00750 [bacterium]|nr:hypothetical protein [bacterium]
MRIGIDLDDVLGDHMGQFIIFHNRSYKTTLERKDFTSFNLSKSLELPMEETRRHLEEFYKSPEFFGTPPMNGSVEAIEILAQKYKLVVITSRPKEQAKDTIDWLDRYFPNKFSDFYLLGNQESYSQKKKAHICIYDGISLLIEDSLENAQDCSTGTRVILYDAPWNQSENLPQMVHRAYSWGDILKMIGSKSIFCIKR